MARILIVDDDDVWTVMLARRLEREDHHVDYALTGESALAMIEQSKDSYEILLVDHRLGPGMDGIELLSRAHEASPSSDAILFTGLEEPDVGLLAYQAGVYRYLHKPFESQELILIIQSLLDWRRTHHELDWMRTLVQIVERLQKADSVPAMGDILVQGGVELGFDRARFYRIRDLEGAATLFGVCQAGINPVLEFDRLVYRLEETIYCKEAHAQGKLTFFRDRELGPSFLSSLPQAEGYPDSLGEWVVVPLFSDDHCTGFLNMDNCRMGRSIPADQKDLLRLFAGHATAALEHAIRHEQQDNSHQLDAMVKRILATMGDPAISGSLDRMLSALLEEFQSHAPLQNFLVTFKDDDSDWLYTRLHSEPAQKHRPYWRPPEQHTMTWWICKEGRAEFLPTGTDEFRRRHELDLVGTPALSWMGAPLRIGEKLTGCMTAEVDTVEYVFGPDDFALLQGLADRLAGVIQAAWLNERQARFNELLNLMQQASEEVMVLAEHNEEWLWHATLTLATAGYAVGFERAMLFLAEDSGTRLHGQMAIGHLNWPKAERAWKEWEEAGSTWQMYLQDLRNGKDMSTPLDGLVRNYSFDVGPGAFRDVLGGGARVIVQDGQADELLSRDFVNRFGRTTYCLVPVRAGERTLGILVLDNRWGKSPLKTGALAYLDTLTNQAALIHENLGKSQAQKTLIEVQHEVLVKAIVSPLQESLERICVAAQEITRADLVAIYPLHGEGDGLRYDQSHVARVGRRNTPQPQSFSVPEGLSKHVLETKQPEYIEDVRGDPGEYFGERRADAQIVRNEGILATIAMPVLGNRTGRPRAVLYLDYRSPRRFTIYDRQMTESLAHLVATAIANWRDAQGLRDAQEALDRELSRLSEVLQSALAAESDERQVAQLLLEKIPGLLSPLPITTGITLKEWERAGDKDDPIEMHRFIYADDSGLTNRLIPASENIGINGRAMRSGVLQNIPNVEDDDDYQPRSEDSDTWAELDVPILVDGQVVGALNIESSQPAAFTKYHEKMGQRFADIAALAIGNARRQRNLRTVLNVAKAITRSVKVRDTLETIANEVRKAFPDLPVLVIWYQNPETKELRLGSCFGVRDVNRMFGKPQRDDGAIQKGLHLPKDKPYYYQTDVGTDPVFQDRSSDDGNDFVANEEIASTAIFLLLAQGETVGVMFFSYRESHTFTEEEERLYPILAEVVAASIQDALLLEEARKEHQKAEKEGKRFLMALDVTETVSKELDQEEVIRKLLTRISDDDLFPNTTAAILRYDKDEHSLIFTTASLPFYFHNDPENPTIRSVPVVGRSIVAAVARMSLASKEKEVINEGNVLGRDEYMTVRPDTQSELAITLWSDEKGLIGVLVLESSQSNAFDGDAVEMASLLARQVRLAMERTLERDDLEVNTTVAVATASAIETAHIIESVIYNIDSATKAIRASQEIRDRSPNWERLGRIEASARRLAMATPPEFQERTSLTIHEHLSDVVTKLVESSAPHIELNYRFCPEELLVECYPSVIDYAMRHLVDNAIHAMSNQSTRRLIQIETHVFRARDEFEIRVIDSGPGFPPDKEHLLFRRRFPQRGNKNGLGLIMVNFTLKRMGGSIRLLPRQSDWGAIFAIRLPLSLPTGIRSEPEVDDGRAI